MVFLGERNDATRRGDSTMLCCCAQQDSSTGQYLKLVSPLDLRRDMSIPPGQSRFDESKLSRQHSLDLVRRGRVGSLDNLA
jgi:hypothetical protein